MGVAGSIIGGQGGVGEVSIAPPLSPSLRRLSGISSGISDDLTLRYGTDERSASGCSGSLVQIRLGCTCIISIGPDLYTGSQFC